VTVDKRLRRFLAVKALEHLPQPVQSRMLDDEAFRGRFGIELEATLTLGPDVARFHRTVLFRAIRRAHAKRGTSVALRDLDGADWHMAIEEQANGAHAVLRQAKRAIILRDFATLDADRSRRLRGFALEAQLANFPDDAIERWTRLLKKRALNDEEASDLERDLAATPVRRMESITEDIKTGHSKLASLVPPDRAYYDRLIGVDSGTARIEDYAQEVAGPLIAGLVAWDPVKGPRLALLLAGHASIMRAIDGATLEQIDLPALASWARDYGDPLSRLGMIEIGAPLVQDNPELDPILAAIAERLLADDPHDEAGHIHLLSAVFMLVDGELSRSQILSQTPPFRRRLASLAQSALIIREIIGNDVVTERFANWCLNERAYLFLCQTLIDLRKEPRWYPDLASARQFRNEIHGRLATIPSLIDGSLPAGPLRTILSDETGTTFMPPSIAAFWPGPLEGAETQEPKPLPDDLSAFILQNLDTPGLDPKSFFAMINSRGFTIDPALIDRAIQSLRGARYRVEDDDPDAVTFAYFGLAAVAAAERRTDLSDEIRILLRRGRHERGAPEGPINELRIAFTAAAAHRDELPWATFIGDWALELALGDITKEQAKPLLVELGLLARLAPALAATTGRARAALSALLGS